MNKLVDFFAIAEKLECEYRTTRMSDGAQQSVASHSWNMIIIAIALQPHLTQRPNMERVMEMCALHDLPEAIIHDVPLHKQTPDVRAKKRAQESGAVSQITDLLGNEKIRNVLDEYEEQVEDPDASVLDRLSADDLLACVSRLPEGYRTVFNLYALEGYTHKEIASLLHIEEITSRSQFSRARKALQEMVQTFMEEKNGSKQKR